jgi:3-hydroxyisobutyrate dehydrogenase-like beta-hydroxyacid dehydrogenase
MASRRSPRGQRLPRTVDTGGVPHPDNTPRRCREVPRDHDPSLRVILPLVKKGKPSCVAFVGLGRMGMPTCARLVERGFPVLATDVRDELRDDVERTGAVWAPTLLEAARSADVLISMLPSASIVSAAAEDIVRSLPPGALWIEMSTASPRTASHAAAIAGPRGIRVLDAPVSGGPDDARSGRLLAFVGGAGGDLDDARIVLACVADRIMHVGRAGSGYLVKLIANTLWFEQAVATAEMLSLARRAGVDLDVLRDAIGESAAESRFMSTDADALLDGDDLTSFSLARCCDQLSGVVAFGSELGVPLALAALVSETHQRALRRYGDVNGELLAARLVAEEAGIELRRE